MITITCTSSYLAGIFYLLQDISAYFMEVSQKKTRVAPLKRLRVRYPAEYWHPCTL